MDLQKFIMNGIKLQKVLAVLYRRNYVFRYSFIHKFCYGVDARRAITRTDSSFYNATSMLI